MLIFFSIIGVWLAFCIGGALLEFLGVLIGGLFTIIIWCCKVLIVIGVIVVVGAVITGLI